MYSEHNLIDKPPTPVYPFVVREKYTEQCFTFRHEYRYQACLIRAQFDATRDEKDMRKLAAMLDETEEKIFQSRHLQPNFYALDEGGICYNRELSNVDMQLDTLHPWEQVRLMIQIFNASLHPEE